MGLGRAQPGQRFGRWELVELLGSGGFGEVWRAKHGEEVAAVKLLSLQSRDAAARFEVEAQTLALVSHPNCVRLLQSGRQNGVCFIVMEFVPGETLRKWVKQPRTEAERLGVATQVIAALSELHRLGITHRDLKPSNILVAPKPDGWRIVLLDFGLAKVVGRREQDITKTGDVLGTIGYMSPEQLRGASASRASDMYALGCVLFHLFEARDPFLGASRLEIAMHQIHGAPLEFRLTPHGLRELIRGLTSPNPGERPTIHEVSKRLAPTTSQAQGHQSQSKSQLPFIAVALAVCVIIGGTVFALGGDEEPTSQLPAPSAATREALLVHEEVVDDAVETVEPIDVGIPVEPMDPCGTALDLAPGVHSLGNARVRIPKGYSNSTKTPLILLFHGAYETPDSALAGFENPLLDDPDSPYIVLAIQGDSVLYWRAHWRDETVSRVMDDYAKLWPALCVDQERVFTVGHADGGRAAIDFACEPDLQISRVVLFGFRIVSTSSLKCLRDGGLPTLVLLPDNDPLHDDSVAPEGCDHLDRRSVVATERVFRKRFSCEEHTTSSRDHGSCNDYAGCTSPLRLCTIEGGLSWPGQQQSEVGAKRQSFRKCGTDRASKFDVSGEIMKFLNSDLSAEEQN